MLASLCGLWLIGWLLLTRESLGAILGAIGADAAEWVSALATFAAVVAALAIAVWEGRRQTSALARQAEDEIRRALRELIAIVSLLRTHTRTARRLSANGEWDLGNASLSTSKFEGSLKRLESLSYDRMPSQDIAERLANFETLCRAALGIARKVEADLEAKRPIPTEAFSTLFEMVEAEAIVLANMKSASFSGW